VSCDDLCLSFEFVT